MEAFSALGKRPRAAPTRTGWYMAWRPLSSGGLGHGVYRCIGGTDGATCAPPGETTFLSTTHEFFDDALWRGPFRSRKAATVVNEFHRV
jgi:hypothetical protein